MLLRPSKQHFYFIYLSPSYKLTIMNTRQKLYLLMGIVLFPLLLHAQTARYEHNILSVHAGPSWYVGDLIGITDYSSSYTNGLKHGMNWSGEYIYLVGKSSFKGGFGILYQGSRFENKQQTNSDKLLMHYIAPQIAVYYTKPKFNLHYATGFGCLMYRDNSTVYDKPRDIKMNKLAFNLALGGEYRIVKHWGVSALFNWAVTSAKTYTVTYHGKEWQVQPHYPINIGNAISYLSLSAGINYHF